MKKKVLALALSMLLAFSGLACAQEAVQKSPETTDSAQSALSSFYTKIILSSLIQQVSENYYYGVSAAKLYKAVLDDTIDHGGFDMTRAMKQIAAQLDDYSEYYSPEDYQTTMESVNGNLFGIGAVISRVNGKSVIMSIIDNSPAQRAGLLAGDVFTAVDAEDVTSLSANALVSKIKGEKGTAVKITVFRGGESLTFDITRDEVSLNPITTKIYADKQAAYIAVSSFTSNLEEFLTPAMKEINYLGIKNIILDLRDNGGGEIHAALALANVFIPQGVVTRLHYKDPADDEELVSENPSRKINYNLVVLANQNSASASELFLAAVQGRQAGTVIGSKSYGKGSMQMVMSLAMGGGMKYTVAEFFSPRGERIHNTGITPDIAVENTAKTLDESAFAPIDLSLDATTAADSPNVLAAEQRLEALGFFDFGFVPDKVFDSETAKAVERFQLANGLTPTKALDIYTLVRLNDIEYDFSVEIDDQLQTALDRFPN